MTIVPLQLPPGVMRGPNQDDAPGRWYECNLVRWTDGTMEPVGGWERITSNAFASAVRRIQRWRDNENTLHSLVGCELGLYSDQGGQAWSNVTPTDFAGFVAADGAGYGAAKYGAGLYGRPITGNTRLQKTRHIWSIANWGQDALCVASSDGRLLHFDASTPTVPVVAVETAPKNNRAVVVTPERHAMLIGEGGNGRGIGWSSREDYTDFDYASLLNTAGFLPLRAETPLLNATLVREGVLIWSETEAFLVRYVGLPYIYGADELGTANLYAPNAFAEFDGKAAWMDSAGFMMYQGGTIRPLPSPLTDYVFSSIDETWGPRNAHAYTNGAYNEVWFHYPTKGNQECNRFVIYNYVADWWAMGEMKRSAGFGAGADPHPVLGTFDGLIYQHEMAWTYADFDPVGNIWIASGTLNLGAGEQSMQVKQLIPSNGAAYDMTRYKILTKMTPGQAEIEHGPYLARPDGYVDVRAQGREVRLKVEANKPGLWSLGRLRASVAAGGRR